MSVQSHMPRRGDVVWITFAQQAGQEQTGRRPAVVLSPGEYNCKTGLAVVCPVTGQVKGYPFEVRLPAGLPVTGAILCDQVKSLDWRAGNAELICRLPPETISEVLAKLRVLFS